MPLQARRDACLDVRTTALAEYMYIKSESFQNEYQTTYIGKLDNRTVNTIVNSKQHPNPTLLTPRRHNNMFGNNTFDPNKDIPDLTGKTYVVTGGSAGRYRTPELSTGARPAGDSRVAK